jgi:hypothetical protein
MKKGDLSKFIEEAVRRRVLQCTIQDIRARNADAGPDEIQRIVDEAVSEVRTERRAEGKGGSPCPVARSANNAPNRRIRCPTTQPTGLR